MEKTEIEIEDLVEIKLFEAEDFLKIKETLTRIGVSSRKDKKLYQSCHILHKRGKYYIVHFKELFALDGLPTNIEENDIARRNTIANLLEDWELLEIVNQDQTEEPVASIAQIKIISHKQKGDWELCPKYHIGNKH
jgi:hypothetical protein|tara:strand:- start:3418 stop:3825 length:408 start_codon:yes stop_codon:yes gene_type:complete